MGVAMTGVCVSRSLYIDKHADKVIDYISDFSTWAKWSPWLILEPKSEVTFSTFQQQPGAQYAWKGERIGAGKMELMHLYDHQLVFNLHYLKPFKGEATVYFNVSPEGKGARVEWQFQGKLPWYMFFFRQTFGALLGMDYTRGLRMLKSAIETGHVYCKLTDLGERVMPQVHYIGVKGSATVEQVGELMQRHFDNLHDYIAEYRVPVCGELFNLYHSMSLKTGIFEFTTCMPVSYPVEAKGKFVAGMLPSMAVYAVQHKGEYQFLGNAWSFASSLTQAKRIKTKGKPMGIEKFLNRRSEVPPEQWLTEVMLIKRSE
ncbi:SRPBCC family protein [Vibrio sp. IRLE0018]|uniref:SRPBCC family protein n=1 Tax=Vibrio floridensis TaxID=2908007 RepID=UPI001A20A15E|nr:SRPBCC family protein [Vibrio floridensis]MCF8779285.1 SRPBCC family protein [Vibrio floridensis]HAS6347368.1 transcriptional regulator [Vibrio vulnificus]